MTAFVRSFVVVLLLASASLAETIRVGAAVSLKDAFEQIAKNYEATAGDKVEFVFGSSGQVLAQVRSGTAMDVFVSAANQQMDALAKDKLIDAATRRVVAGNTLVLVVPADAKSPPADFAGLADAAVAKIAVGEPKTVPAGLYARQTLDALHLSAAVGPKLVYGSNVRQVLAYVEQGEVAAGLVYATDARQSGDKVKVVATADEASHEPIVYPAAVLTASKQAAAAKKFLDYLATPAAAAVLKDKGFTESPSKTPGGA